MTRRYDKNSSAQFKLLRKVQDVTTYAKTIARVCDDLVILVRCNAGYVGHGYSMSGRGKQNTHAFSILLSFQSKPILFDLSGTIPSMILVACTIATSFQLCHLGTFVIADTDVSFASSAVGPETADIDVGLGSPSVGD